MEEKEKASQAKAIFKCIHRIPMRMPVTDSTLQSPKNPNDLFATSIENERINQNESEALSIMNVRSIIISPGDGWMDALQEARSTILRSLLRKIPYYIILLSTIVMVFTTTPWLGKSLLQLCTF
jgi:hypothetical protein